MTTPPADLTRRLFLGTAAAAIAIPAATPAAGRAPERSPRPPPNPARGRAGPAVSSRARAPDADRLIAAARLGGAVAFAVAAPGGALLEAARADEGLPPASVAKAITALYALDRLGPGHRFATRLLATGPLQGGRIEGDLIMLGGGDPTLDTDALADLAAAAAARGIRGVTGRFVVHGGTLPTLPTIDPEQPAHVGYSPAVGGLNLNYNRVHFEWARSGAGYRVGMDARAARHRPDVYVTRMAVVERGAPLYTYRADGRFEDWTVMRAALGTGGSRWLPVRQPEIYAGDVFQTLARAQGLALPNPEVATGRALPAATEIARHDSAPLADILRDMLRWSTNLTAEVVGMAASAAAGAPPRGLADSAGRAARWAEGRFGVTGLRLVDHSGLGDASRLSAGALVGMLAHPGAMAPLRPLLRRIELRDETGATLPDQTLRVAAKTGTLNFVSGLGGYVTTPGGRDLVFAILTADLPRHNAVPDARREHPEGGRAWVTRARGLQARLLQRWAAVHG